MNDFEKKMGIRKQHPAEMLQGLLALQSTSVNEIVEKKHGLKNLLQRDGALNSKEYSELYSEAEIEADEKFVREREIKFSVFYKDEPSVHNEDEQIQKWREARSREKSGQMEMAVTALLSQMLGEDFLVVRTAPYDDYKNGVDNLIVNRATGEVVGAFDEVHDSKDGHRTEEKKAKILKIAKHGGAEIRYGLGFKRGKLKRARLEGVPVFYLGLESSELEELVSGLGENDSVKKEKIFRKLLDSLLTQQIELKKSAGTIQLCVRLNSFGESLSKLIKTEQKEAA